VNGREVDRRQVVLNDSQERVSFTRTLAQNDIFEVSVESGDALEIDDKAWGVAGAGQNVKVCLVTEGNLPLERALRAGEGLDLRVVSVSRFSVPLDNEVVVVDGQMPALNQPGKAGGYLFVGTVDPFGCMQADQWRDCPRVTHWSSGHPCMTDVDPTAFRIPRALGVTPSPAFTSTELAGASSTPLVLEVKGLHTLAPDLRPIRCLYWLFQVRDTDLPTHLGFPVMLWNAIDYLNGNAAADRSLQTTGQPLELPLQRNGPPRVANPLGESLEVKIVGEKTVVVDTVHAGIYRFDGYRPEACAINLFSTQSLHPIQAGAAAQDRTPLAPPEKWRRYAGVNWQSLVLMCVLVGLVEWFLFQRRVLRL
jgi:hypothetical protein